MLINNANITGSLAVVGTTVLSGSLAVSTLSGSGVRYLVSDGAGNMTAQTASAAIKNAQSYTASAGQTTFAVTNGYTTNLVDVYINGSKLLDGLEYNDTSGTNIVLTTGSFAGDIVEIVTYQPASGVTNNSLRTLTSFTATAGQTTFSASYVPGLLDVYYNGSRLNTVDYTAANGNSIILTTGSNTGDILDVLVYSYQVGAFSGIGGAGVANQIAYWNTTNSITGSSNFIFNGSALAITGSFAVFTGSAAEFQVNATGVNLGNALTDSHVISGSLRVNPNGLFVSSSGLVGIGNVVPAYTLDVSGSGRYNGSYAGHLLNVQNTNASYYSSTDYYDNAGTEKLIVGYGNASTGNALASKAIIYGTSGVALNFYTNGSTTAKMVIDTSGNVGIGTTPSSWDVTIFKGLQIANSNAFIVGRVDAASQLQIGTNTYYNADGNWKFIQNGYATRYIQNGGVHSWEYSSASGTAGNNVTFNEAMRITSGGQVNVNSTQTTYPFYVQAALANWTTVFENTANSSSGLLVRQTGGSQGFYYGAYDGGAYKFYVTGTGNIHSTSTSITIISSDIKLKTDIRDYDKGLSEVLAMKPRIYKRKDNLEVDEVGFIAQEMDIALAGSMIESYKDENEESVMTYQLEWYPLLVKAIQEMNTKSEEQQALITSLQSQITELKNK
jgi:hypothetical protein